MLAKGALTGWTGTQKHVVAASYLGWTLDAFDFFVLTFVVKDIAAEFKVGIPAIALALTLTLALRPLGAFIFGRLADRFGRRPVLMANIATYSVLSFATAFVPNLATFLIVRALFGVGMGGVWGIGASLSMETVKPQARGFVSGLLQSGYSMGNLLATLVYGIVYVHVGWRGMFMVGIVPSLLLIPYVYFTVPESSGFDPARASRINLWMTAFQSLLALALGYFLYEIFQLYLFPSLGWWGVTPLVLVVAAGAFAVFPFFREHWKLMLYAILLMTAFTSFSHGSQDLYPTFLQIQHHYAPAMVKNITAIGNIGAILGGILFGSLSQTLGRRRTIIAAALLAIPVIYLWAFSETAVLLAIGAFVLQVFVQGAWGVIPAHLNEISPGAVRGTFAGTVYQFGNLLASVNAVTQATIAEQTGGKYSIALAVVVLGAAIAIALLVKFGPEAQNVDMAKT